ISGQHEFGGIATRPHLLAALREGEPLLPESRGIRQAAIQELPVGFLACTVDVVKTEGSLHQWRRAADHPGCADVPPVGPGHVVIGLMKTDHALCRPEVDETCAVDFAGESLSEIYE